MALLRFPNKHTIIMIRRNARMEAELNALHVRANPRELRWSVRGEIWQFENEFAGRSCNIIGKGPSLDSLMNFGNEDPIFAINESIVKVEQLDFENQLFAVRKDMFIGDIHVPKKAQVICTPNVAAKLEPLTDNYTVVTAGEIQRQDSCLTIVYTLGIAKIMGFTKACLYCFDACTTGNTDYADCIGRSLRPVDMVPRQDS